MPRFVTAILDALHEVVPADLVTVLEVEADQGLRVLGCRGPLASHALEGLAIDLGDRPGLRRLLAGDRPGLLEHHEDGAEDDAYSAVLRLPDDHACLAAPLRHEGDLVGALTLDSARCGAFGDETLRAVAGFARLAAWAIVESRHAERLDRSLSLLTDRVGRDPGEAARLGLVGESTAWRRVLDRARLVAPSEAVVLLAGETGTGKERIARAIHAWSARAGGPFIAVNCSVLLPQLAGSELFGHERGAFTGADRRRAGRFELAEGGTIFLDEVAELPPETQAQLLRVLQERSFERVGGSSTLRADVRVIAASHKDLQEEARAGRFRDDLYYRLAIFPLTLPPLRDRPGDLVLLVQHLLRQLLPAGDRPAISRAALHALERHDWPGNVRELANVLERATILAAGGSIEAEHLGITLGQAAAPQRHSPFEPDLPEGLGRLDRAQAREILAALAETGGRISGRDGAAERLGIKATTLRSRMLKLGIL
ncbi:MAG: sigma 54-interacting transcriptional regulator [Planctomycetes bacterium]|nr:sigma 54-interacting transcriptional regulator [Planctomycetota bacterium]